MILIHINFSTPQNNLANSGISGLVYLRFAMHHGVSCLRFDRSRYPEPQSEIVDNFSQLMSVFATTCQERRFVATRKIEKVLPTVFFNKAQLLMFLHGL